MAKKEVNNKISFYPFLFEIGYSISVPLIIFVLLGIWLDKKLDSWHLFLFLGIGLSLFSSTYAIYKTIKKVK